MAHSLFAAEPATAPRSLGDLRGIFEANFNRDGSRVVVRMRNGEIGFWEATTGTAVKGDLDPQTRATCYVMSADGDMVLIGSEKDARVFDATTGLAVSPVLDVRLRENLLPPAVFSPDKAAVVIFEQEHASVWTVGNGERVATTPLPPGPHEDAPPSAVFVAAGAQSFIMNADGVVTRYDTKTWKASGKPMRHPRFDTAYEFSFKARDDGKFIATMDDAGENGPKGQLQLWDAMNGKPLGAPLVTTNGFGARFLPGADRVLVQPARGDASVRALPSMKTAYTIRAHDELDGPKIEISPDGKWIISWGPDRQIDVINAATGKPAGYTSSGAALSKVLLSPESSDCYAVFDNSAFFLQNYHDHYVMKMSLPELKITASIRVLEYLLRVSLSPDGRRLLLLQGMSDHERIRIFDTADLKPLLAE